MIRNDKEYKIAIGRLQQEKQRLKDHSARLAEEGLDESGVRRVLEPIQCFHEQLREETEAYERLKRGDIGEVHNLYGLGCVLVGLRIARGWSQKQLADKLGVHVTQVSRDERNEYHGVTVERASRILDALEVDLASSFAAPVLPLGSS